jgi:DNA-binding MarR family transcriptional regulator
MLSSAGLTNSQYSLLVNVGREGSVSRTALAERLGMDRTTLTRNLKPLEAEKLIVSAKSDDRRERLLKLSPTGRQKLRKSYEQWETAQRLFTSQLGETTLRQLRTILHAAEQAAENAIKGMHP